MLESIVYRLNVEKEPQFIDGLFRSNLTTQKARDSRERIRTMTSVSSSQDRINTDVKEQLVREYHD